MHNHTKEEFGREGDQSAVHVEVRDDSAEASNEYTPEKSQSKKYSLLEAKMIPAKAMFFFWGGLVTPRNFTNPFFVSVGLSTSQAGLINGLGYIPSIIAEPLWGMFADCTGLYQLAFAILCFGSAFSTFSIPWVAGAINNPSNNRTMQIDLSNDTRTPMPSNESPNNTTLFYVMLTLTVFSAMFIQSLLSFAEAIVNNFVKTSRRQATYGEQRNLGKIGDFAFTYLGGFLADHFNLDWVSKYTAVYCEFLICVFLVLILGSFLLRQVENWKRREGNTLMSEKKDKRITAKLKKLFFKRDTVFFMITVLLSGLAWHIFIFFGLVLVKDEMESSKANMSLVPAIAAISSAIMFPFSTMIVKRIGGPFIAMTAGMFSHLIRFLGMSFCKELWLMILLQVLDAVGFALAWCACVEYINETAASEINTTVFLITTTLHFTVSSCVANLAGGKGYAALGGRILFRSVGIACGVWGCVMIVYYVFFKEGAKLKGSGQTVSQLTVQTMEQSSSETNGQTMEQTISETTFDNTMEQTTTDTKDKTMEQTISETTAQKMEQTKSETTDSTIDQTVSEATAHTMEQTVSETTSQGVEQTVSETKVQTMGPTISRITCLKMEP